MTLDPLWYQKAVIYQVNVRSFFDANGDGIGDFKGITAKLDYLAGLGVTALWLMPFYPSPLRDDGYDISDYLSVNPAYGTVEDVQELIREAHSRNLKVVTELIINHTSDQHPWFQRARQAPIGSDERNFYVWSDTGEEYSQARIIFKDFEPSNWTWDEVAGQYFWHRFFHHQPDLNFDNPAVEAAVFEVLDFWLDLGVDGFRLDAIPYLYEREGTTGENLPETHALLKRLRKRMDDKYPGRMLLAEANQWPEDTLPYFGDGDECHMNYNFPVMPRLYMSLIQESRRSLVEILEQTPEIPEGCQWAMFLRNHDELTLEMVSEEERDFMWRAYSPDPRGRINLGVRRRLFPLVENSVDKARLLNSLLLSMPGTPVLYYGDEIGMGDNLELPDRFGVRTPMQWSDTLNAGFSTASPELLQLPVIVDSVYGAGAVNVQRAELDKSSQLHWMRRILQVRAEHPVFGQGSFTFLEPENEKIVAYLRENAEESILVVVNLADSIQSVDLDLRAYAGSTPFDLFGESALPVIGSAAYSLTLSAHSFLWLKLSKSSVPGSANRKSVLASIPLPSGSHLSLVQPNEPGREDELKIVSSDEQVAILEGIRDLLDSKKEVEGLRAVTLADYSSADEVTIFSATSSTPNPAFEYGLSLRELSPSVVQPITGYLEWVAQAGNPKVLAVSHAKLSGQSGDALFTSYFQRYREGDAQGLAEAVSAARELGRAVGSLHSQLAQAFGVQAFTPHYQRSMYATLRSRSRWDSSLNQEQRLKQFDSLEPLKTEVIAAQRIRVHGELTLHNAVLTESGFVLKNLSGDESKSLAERQIKLSPWVDVASLCDDLWVIADGADVTFAAPWRAWLIETVVAGYRETADLSAISESQTHSQLLLLLLRRRK